MLSMHEQTPLGVDVREEDGRHGEDFAFISLSCCHAVMSRAALVVASSSPNNRTESYLA